MIFNYWLATDGILHDAGTDTASHNEWAKQYLINTYGEKWYSDWTMSDTRGYPYQKLHEIGWVRISIDKDREQIVRIFGDGMDLTRPMRNAICPAMNALQMHIAKMVCEEENFDFYKAINDKRFW